MQISAFHIARVVCNDGICRASDCEFYEVVVAFVGQVGPPKVIDIYLLAD